MGLFDRLTGKKAPEENGREITEEEMRQEVSRASADPFAYLKARNFSIPQGMTDPRQITQHLLRSGQVSPDRLRMVLRKIGAPLGR